MDKNIYLRRNFVKGATFGIATLTLAPSLSFGNLNNSIPKILKGNIFHLSIAEQIVNFTGKTRIATTVNNSLPAPILRFKEGDDITLYVKNNLKETSSIHWHGLILPSKMDGVPNISTNFEGIAPGKTFIYRFKAKQSGTYWYHSHSFFQEQTGLYGAIVIDPIKKEPFAYDRDYVVMLSDWSDENPNAIYAKLKKLSHYYNLNERTRIDLMKDIKEKGVIKTWKSRAMWNEMRMSQRDLSDVTGATYTYLINGQTPDKSWVGLFKKGESIRLRFINGSAMSFFDIRIPGLKMKVIASDGQNIEPISIEEFRIGVAETYDVIVQPQDDMAYSIFAEDISRSGYALGTLSTNIAMKAKVPKLSKVPYLSHGDMGMGVAKKDYKKVTHMPSEYGAQVDMHASTPQYRLSDPGVGLRNNNRRVLVYGDLYNIEKTKNYKDPTRELQLHLTGNMNKYMWSINGIKFNDAKALKFKMGEIIRITLVNDTMMNHPIHLHGMWSDLESGDNDYLPRKHTIVVQPGSKISYRVKVDARGSWAYHCHLLYHMLGMFRRVDVV